MSPTEFYAAVFGGFLVLVAIIVSLRKWLAQTLVGVYGKVVCIAATLLPISIAGPPIITQAQSPVQSRPQDVGPHVPTNQRSSTATVEELTHAAASTGGGGRTTVMPFSGHLDMSGHVAHTVRQRQQYAPFAQDTPLPLQEENRHQDKQT